VTEEAVKKKGQPRRFSLAKSIDSVGLTEDSKVLKGKARFQRDGKSIEQRSHWGGQRENNIGHLKTRGAAAQGLEH